MGCYKLFLKIISDCPICRYRHIRCSLCGTLTTTSPIFRYTGTVVLIIFLRLPVNLFYFLYRGICFVGNFFYPSSGRDKFNDNLDSRAGDKTDDQKYEVQYVGCDPDGHIGGTKITKIVQHFFSNISMPKMNMSDPETTYRKYCNILEENLSGSEPYHKTIKVEITEKDHIANQMRDLLPFNRSGHIESVITEISEDVVAHFQNRAQLPSLSQTNVSSFVALNVSKYGENLEIIPCHMVVINKWNSYISQSGIKKREMSYYVEYKQEKFILTKFQIANIHSKLPEILLNDDNTPLYGPLPLSQYQSTSNN